MTTVLLGVSDGRISDGSATSWNINKIGGYPDWMTAEVHDPRCAECGCTLSLLVQVYCPLERSAYHRTIYVFACRFPPCWLRDKCWKVYRCQRLDPECQQGRSKTIETTPGEKVSVADDSWGEDADDWGDDDMDADELVSMVTNSGNKTSDNSVQSPVQYIETSASSVEGDDVIDDIADNIREVSLDQSNTKESETCIPEDMNIVQEKTALFSILTGNSNSAGADCQQQNLQFRPTENSSDALVLNSYYISVFAEPEKCEVFDHEHQLLAEYQRKEGVDIAQIVACSKVSGSGGESYEHGIARHGDHSFHKFQKKTQTCPEQVIRYDYKGRALHIQAEPRSPSLTCSHCSKPCYFELQLMPTLVTLLRTTTGSDPVVEFGTVHIYTCQDSCWSDGDVYREEHAVVYPDPDQKFFKK